MIAHLSEGIPRHWLIDNTALEAFLANELEYGLRQSRRGQGARRCQRHQRYPDRCVRNVGADHAAQGHHEARDRRVHAQHGLRVTPADWEGVELALSSQSAIEHLSLPYDPATRRLFGVPVTTSNAQAAGVGHVLAADSVALDTDTRGVDVQWSENATADELLPQPDSGAV